MATNWPNSVQTFTNPNAGDSLNSPSHSEQHTTVNDTVEALQEYAGLVLVQSVTVGSAVSSVTLAGVFSATYQSYRVMVCGIDFSTTNTSFNLQFNTATTGYYGMTSWINYLGSTGTIAQNNSPNGTVANTTPYANMAISMDIHDPFGTDYTMVLGQSIGNAYRQEFGFGSAAGSNTGFTLSPYSGTMTGGTIRVYGYNNG